MVVVPLKWPLWWGAGSAARHRGRAQRQVAQVLQALPHSCPTLWNSLLLESCASSGTSATWHGPLHCMRLCLMINSRHVRARTCRGPASSTSTRVCSRARASEKISAGTLAGSGAGVCQKANCDVSTCGEQGMRRLQG
jgi:hypothetical protein